MEPQRLDDQDLTHLLAAWSYEEGKTIRCIKAADGRDVLQVRLPLGLEQYELDGRPDGKRPMNQESWLHYYWQKARQALKRSEDFTLSEEALARLQEEGILYYYRYLVFFQIHEYALCARDTRRNLKLLDFAARYSPPEQAELLEQYRPYILRMNTMAKVLLKVKGKNDIHGALRLLNEGLQELRSLTPIPDNPVSTFERSRSLKCLEELKTQLRDQLPHAALEKELAQAVEEENYEKAAKLRDRIASLKRRGEGSS